jgi:hypothetical protein
MSEGKTRIPALEGTPEEIANYKEAFRMMHSPDWIKNSIPMDAAAENYTREASELQEAQQWKCGARQRNIGPEIQDCDWPVCGCDPYASKVLDAIEEGGFKIVRDEARDHQAPLATLAAHHGATGENMTDPDYDEALRLIRKHKQPGDTIGKMFMRVAKALEEPRGKRTDLAIMLTAWNFWGELSPELRSELLDCIEHTYAR